MLAGGALNYYRTDLDAQTRGNFALHRCSVVKEGTKQSGKGQIHHVMALYLHGTEQSERGPSSGALLRVSSESEDNLHTWFKALAPRCMFTTGIGIVRYCLHVML